MTQPPKWKGINLDTPAVYRIRVQGHLDDSWSDRLAGMVITKAYMENKLPTTILVGRLADQAALSGVLNALYDLHMPLLSVENVGEE